jgi:hypothetical protein
MLKYITPLRVTFHASNLCHKALLLFIGVIACRNTGVSKPR